MLTQDSTELEYALIVLWEMLEHQAPLLEGRETEVFSALLRVRYNAHTSVRINPWPLCYSRSHVLIWRHQVMQATTQLRDIFTSRIEPVYGLTTMHATVRSFRDSPPPTQANMEVKNGTYAFGLIALGKFILRLPAEVLEDELPRLKDTLNSVRGLRFSHEEVY